MRSPLSPVSPRQAIEASPIGQTRQGARRSHIRHYALPVFLLLAAFLSGAIILTGSLAAPAKKSAPSRDFQTSVIRGNRGAISARSVKPPRATNTALVVPFLFQGPAAPIQTFAGDCTTAQADWSLGATVCVKVSAITNPSRIQLINPAGYSVDRVDVTFTPFEHTFTLPSSATTGSDGVTFDNRGTWRIVLTDIPSAGALYSVPITVHDAQPVANLQVVKLLAGSTLATAGSNIQTIVRVFNAGPDAAANVRFTDVPPANTTFQSIQQTGGPTFACSTNAGISICTLASLGKDVAADFIVTYQVNANIADATALTTTASADTDTTETSSEDNGASDSATSDNPAPPACTISCAGNVTVTAAQGQNGANVTFAGPQLGGTCGSVTSTPSSGSFFPVGTTPVTSSTSDGQTCSFFVTVNPAEDTAAPTISCPADISVPESSSAANSATVSYSVTASDDSGAVAVDCDPPSGSTFPVGTTQVRCTAADQVGNTAECNFNVTVTQTGCDLDANSAQPVPNVASLPTITRSCSATLLPADDPTATDACGGIVNGDTTSDRTYDVPGTYTVVWTYTDSAGHTATQNQTVVILPDNSAPVPDAASLPTVTDECSAAITGPAPTAHDNCGGQDMPGAALDPLSYNTPGTYTVRWQFTDPAGNTTIQNQTVVVTDTQAPVTTLTGPSSETVECHTSYTDAGATATDNCTPAPTPTITSNDVNVNAPGTYHVVWSATDGGGNTSTATRTVTVVDTTSPVIALNGSSTVTVECHTSYTDAGATASDSCDTSVPVNVSGSVNVNVVGSYTLTYTASDDSGNAATQVTRTVNVVDTIAPVVTLNGANPMIVILGSAFVDPNATASDSCAGSLSVTVSGAVNTNAIGTYALTYSATDGSGNTGTATRTVNVIYNFTGFFSPVHNEPTINQVNGGRSIPVKFSLAGNQGLGIMAAGSPYSQQISCSTSAPISDIEATDTPGGSTLTYSGGQYHYNWKSESSWAGTCRLLTVALIDGTTHTATFKFQ